MIAHQSDLRRIKNVFANNELHMRGTDAGGAQENRQKYCSIARTSNKNTLFVFEHTIAFIVHLCSLVRAHPSTTGMSTAEEKKHGKCMWKSWVHGNVPKFARVCSLLIAKKIWWLVGSVAYRHRENFNLVCSRCCMHAYILCFGWTVASSHIFSSFAWSQIFRVTRAPRMHKVSKKMP